MVFQTNRGPFKNRKQNANLFQEIRLFFKLGFLLSKKLWGGFCTASAKNLCFFCWKLSDKFLFGGVTVFFLLAIKFVMQVVRNLCGVVEFFVTWLVGWIDEVHDLNLHIFVEITWSKSWIRGIILLMDKILHHQGWWISHYLRDFDHLRWLFGILSINSLMLVTKPNHPWSPRDSVAAPMVSVVLGAGWGTWNVRQVGRSRSGLGFLPRLP